MQPLLWYNVDTIREVDFMFGEYIAAKYAIDITKKNHAVTSYGGVYIVPEDKYIELIIHKMENESNKNKTADKP